MKISISFYKCCSIKLIFLWNKYLCNTSHILAMQISPFGPKFLRLCHNRCLAAVFLLPMEALGKSEILRQEHCSQGGPHQWLPQMQYNHLHLLTITMTSPQTQVTLLLIVVPSVRSFKVSWWFCCQISNNGIQSKLLFPPQFSNFMVNKVLRSLL